MRNQMYAWNDERGTTAVEFAIVGPVFIVLVIGMLYMCIALFTVGSLHYAVEEGARCASVKSTVCTNASTTLAYTKNHYFGPGTLPNFSYNTAANCVAAGFKSVSATLNYDMNLGLQQFTIPIAATACFP
jgi:Flp pilus assembly protein TadG